MTAKAKRPREERRTVKPAELVANPRNPRLHSPAQVAHLVASIERFGQPKPVLARAENMMLIAGHGVWMAMTQLGREVDVILWDVSQKTADEFMVADNRLGELSTDDDDLIAQILRETDHDAWAALGFDPESAAALIEDTDVITVKAIDTTEVADRYWISVRGPLAEQAHALQRLQAAMADLKDCEVELGTIAG